MPNSIAATDAKSAATVCSILYGISTSRFVLCSMPLTSSLSVSVFTFAATPNSGRRGAPVSSVFNPKEFKIVALRECPTPPEKLLCVNSAQIGVNPAVIKVRNPPGHVIWDGWDGPGRSWDGCKSENHACLPALGRWDGCTP